MSKVSEAKVVLKESINRLQKVVQARIDELEVENSTLRTQIVQLKQELLLLKKQKAVESNEQLSLDELKKIAG